jgi:hypothetical protein
MSPLAPVAAEARFAYRSRSLRGDRGQRMPPVKQSELRSNVAVQSSLRRDKPDGGGRLHGNRLNDQISSVALEETPHFRTCNSRESEHFRDTLTVWCDFRPSHRRPVY